MYRVLNQACPRVGALYKVPSHPIRTCKALKRSAKYNGNVNNTTMQYSFARVPSVNI